MPDGPRFNAQRMFLTYSQTTPRLTPEVVLLYLEKKAEIFRIRDYLISHETHKDGGKHIHAYLKFETKLDIKNMIFMDIVYYRKVYHPNIQKVTQVHKLWEYIKKEKRYITNLKETRPLWKVMVEESATKQELLESLLWYYGDKNQYLQSRLILDLYREFRINSVIIKKSTRDRFIKP